MSAHSFLFEIIWEIVNAKNVADIMAMDMEGGSQVVEISFNRGSTGAYSCPPVRINPTPLNASWPAIVTINAGSAQCDTMKPCIAAIAIAQTIMTSITKIGLTLYPIFNTAPMPLSKSTTDPIDRSIPPVRITTIMPTAEHPSMELWRIKVATFLAERKTPPVAK